MLNLKQSLKRLTQETYALYYACKDPRVPWYARLIALCVVAYAFSPIDLIPDFIPVVGYLDDLLLVPLGILLVLRFIPKDVMRDARQQAEAAIASGRSKPINRIAAGVIVCLWLVSAGLIIWFFVKK